MQVAHTCTLKYTSNCTPVPCYFPPLLLYKIQNTLAVKLHQYCAHNHSEEALSGVNKSFNLLCAVLL